MKNLRAYIPLFLFLVIATLAAVPLVKGRDPSVLPSALVGKPVPAFKLAPALGGKGFSDVDLKKSKTASVVNFFASWCPTCHREQPVLAQLAREMKVKVYGIDYKDTKENLKPWLARHGNPFAAIGSDAAGRTAIDWGVYGVPETFIIDRHGIIRAKYVGALTMEFYQATLKPALESIDKNAGEKE